MVCVSGTANDIDRKMNERGEVDDDTRIKRVGIRVLITNYVQEISKAERSRRSLRLDRL